MSFLAPWFLLGGLAALIPLVLHLRRSRKTDLLIFSTTRFFDEQFLRATHRARLQDRLLMILRMLLLILLALALAQPLIQFPALGKLVGLAGSRRVVAIVLDDSASMGLASAQGMLLERAKRGAQSVLDDLSPVRGDKATVILAGSRDDGPHALFEEPTSDLRAVREAIQAVTLTDLGTDLDAAVVAAARQLGTRNVSGRSARPTSETGSGGGSGSREIYVLSDLQDMAFTDAGGLDPGKQAALFMVATRPETSGTPADVSVDAIQYGASRPLLGVPFTFRALLTNHGEVSRGATANLVIGGKVVAQKTIELPAGRSQIARMTYRFARPGWYSGHVELSGGKSSDALDSNNRRYFSLRVAQGARLLAVNGAPSQIAVNDELFFLRLALSVQQPADRAAALTMAHEDGVDSISVKTATVNDLTRERLEPYPLALLANVANLPPATLEIIEHYVDRGGNLLITLGDHVDQEAYNSWIGLHRLHGGLLPGRLQALEGKREPAAASAEMGDAGFIASVEHSHPALAGFGEGSLGSLSAVHFTARFNIQAPEAAVLMRAANGQPLLLEKRFGKGRVMLFASSIDRDWCNFPLQPTYVPWVYRVLGYLAQAGLEGETFKRTGQVVVLPSSATKVQALVVQRQGDEKTAAPSDRGLIYPEPRQLAASDASSLVVTATELAGLYNVRPAAARAGEEPLMLFAVNAPPEEFELRYLDKDKLKSRIATEAWMFIESPESIGGAGEMARRGYGLWDQLLMFALLVGLVEPFLANWLSRRRNTDTPDLSQQRSSAAPAAARKNA